jgi:PIN domain nuclease of toxin-antitoxin system
MNYLLDSHVLIWLVTDQSKISDLVIKELDSGKNNVFVSSVSFWEIALKFSSGKLELNGFLPHDLPNFIQSVGFESIALTAETASSYNNLSGLYHKDPFDRMLIWQAIQQNLILVTKDERIKQYSSDGLKSIW